MSNDNLVLGLDHIQVNAPPDEYENARWFYGAVLRLRELPVRQTVISDSGPLWFEVAPGQQLRLTFEPQAHNAAVSGHVALRVRSVAAVLDALRANGFDAYADGLPGTSETRCFCRDPFGNRLEFVEYVGVGFPAVVSLESLARQAEPAAATTC